MLVGRNMLSKREFLQQLGLFFGVTALGTVSPKLVAKASVSRPDYGSSGAKLLTRSTPRQDGFFFPAEWREHDYTIMAWPPVQNWQDYGLDAAWREWAGVANAISRFEPVLMVVDPADERHARPRLSSDIELLVMPLNDGWSRDSGPMFLIDGYGRRRIAGFRFNGWGEKFPPYDDDALLKARLAAHLDVPMYPADMVLEGGGIVVDGDGTAIVTEQCLLNPNRNPGMSKAQVERYLADYLGIAKVIWLGQGLTPDPITDGHADGLCAFVDQATVLLHSTNERSDPNYAICRDARRRLLDAIDAKGRSLEIIDLPLAENALHMGFYIANDCVIVPVANRRVEDDAPLAILRDLFPERKVVGVSGRTLALGGGSVHCITQQVPKV